MDAVVGLLRLLLLIGVSHGLETHCDGRKNGIQCYEALGGTVVIQLMDSASEITRYEWSKGRTKILRGRMNDIQFNAISNRSGFTPNNGTFRINDLRRTDSGEYTLEMYNSDLKVIGKRTLQLSIQAPVSSVLLVSECLSQGQMRVSCSSVGGDSPQYRWNLDGLTDDELLSGSTESEIITLKANVSGYLTCSVTNGVSGVCGFIFSNCSSSNGTQMSKMVQSNDTVCSTPTTAPTTTTVGKETGIVSIKPSNNNTSSNQTVTPGRDDRWYNNLAIIGGVLAALLIFLLVGVAVYSQKKKQSTKPEEEGDDKELTYADVKFMQRPGRQVEQRADVEVEYGQVRFSERPQQTELRENDCVYAKVRRSR